MNFDCLYCNASKAASESSLEHAVPQFLGGAQAPGQYKLRSVCGTCNNRLGLHVDGSYAKSWFVTNALAESARKYYGGPGRGHVLPLTCIGPVNIPDLFLADGAVAELWLGPSGETIIWARSDDEALYWYTGGNPTHRKRESTVYFFPVSGDPVRMEMGTEALAGAFKKTKARRVFGVPVIGLPLGEVYPGFDFPSDVEEENVQAIRKALSAGNLPARIGMNTKFDLRFMCKMALAIGFSLFGDAYLATREAAEARLGVWPNPHIQPRLRGSSTFFVHDTNFSKIAGYDGAVVILVMRVGQVYAMSMTVNCGLPLMIEICSGELLSEFVDPQLGYSLILFPMLQRCVELSTPDLLAHKLGNVLHPVLSEIDKQRDAASAFWRALVPVSK